MTVTTAQVQHNRTVAARVAAQVGIPAALFERVIDRESHFDPAARSGAGALGIAQFEPGTAPTWGVNLYDGKIEDDLTGSARYLKYYHDKFGNWRDALVAYNAGAGAVGKPLPAETSNYVAAILGPGAGAGLNLAASGGGGTPGPSSTSSGVSRGSSGANQWLKLLLEISLVGGGAALALAGLARMVGVRNPAALATKTAAVAAL